MDEQDRIIEIFRPTLRSLWFLFFGLALGPAILLFGREPRSPWWIGLVFFCLGLILHRLSLKYTLSEKKITAQAWWGRGPAEEISLARAGEITARSGLAGRAAGVAHIEIRSLEPNETGLTLLGQPRALVARLENMAALARRAETSAPDPEAGKRGDGAG